MKANLKEPQAHPELQRQGACGILILRVDQQGKQSGTEHSALYWMGRI